MNHSSIIVIMAQLDFLVGDVEGNGAKIRAACQRAQSEFNADLVVFPELALTGYPPEDLLFREVLHKRVEAMMQSLCRDIGSLHAVIGHPTYTRDGLFNSASVLHDGQIIATYHKHHLPNYSVFDEKRYFNPGSKPVNFMLKDARFGITICEDIWLKGPIEQSVDAGASHILCLNASPFHHQKLQQRETILKEAIKRRAVPIIYVNTVGGQDELVFDGASMVMLANGEISHRGPLYEEALIPVILERKQANKLLTIRPGEISPLLNVSETIYKALVLGVRDYVHKNNFKGVYIGLSGGIDSALTLAIAVDALGASQVEAILMPSRFTALMSIEDAIEEANALNVKYHLLPIEKAQTAFLDILKDTLKSYPEDITEENIQARCRGILLMAMSNKTGKMVLTTGNKSEMAVGYATLYGDMAGGFAALKDVPKTLVYQLAHFRNQQSPIIPKRVFERAPSAELKNDQTDQDSLPPYDILDAVIERYVTWNESRETIINAGFKAKDVDDIIKRIDRNEYKRRQSPPGVRISSRAFGRDWRYPITSGYGKSYEKN